MSSYARFDFHAVLKTTTPEDVKELLYLMADGRANFGGFSARQRLAYFDHPFFGTRNGARLFISSYDGFNGPDTLNSVGPDEHGRLALQIESELRSEDAEIEEFLDWIRPYIEPPARFDPEEKIAWYCSDDFSSPVHVYLTPTGSFVHRNE